MNVSNTCNIPIIHKKLLVSCYNGDTEYHIESKCHLPCNEENIKQAKEAREASLVSGTYCDKGYQLRNNCGKWKRDKDKSKRGDNNVRSNNFGNCVQKRGNIWM